MRCMTLAEALRRQGHAITFICRELPGNCIFALKNKDFSVFTLSYNVNMQASLLPLPQHQQWLGETRELDLQHTLAHLITLKKIDWLVIDHYGLDAEWEAACRPYTNRIMVIDDLADRVHESDMLLDQNYYATTHNRYALHVNTSCKVLLGPQYALLRPEFSEHRKQIGRRNGEVKRLMVSLGGCDPDNGTQKILAGIDLSQCRHLDIDIILGSTSQHRENIQQWCFSRPNYRLHFAANNMAELMKNSDLAIGAGGTTTWERCCLGLPSLAVKIADNQDELIKQAFSANILDYLGDIGSLRVDSVANKLDMMASDPEKLKLISQNAMQMVDGLGVSRVINELLLIS